MTMVSYVKGDGCNARATDSDCMHSCNLTGSQASNQQSNAEHARGQQQELHSDSYCSSSSSSRPSRLSSAHLHGLCWRPRPVDNSLLASFPNSSEDDGCPLKGPGPAPQEPQSLLRDTVRCCSTSQQHPGRHTNPSSWRAASTARCTQGIAVHTRHQTPASIPLNGPCARGAQQQGLQQPTWGSAGHRCCCRSNPLSMQQQQQPQQPFQSHLSTSRPHSAPAHSLEPHRCPRCHPTTATAAAAAAAAPSSITECGDPDSARSGCCSSSSIRQRQCRHGGCQGSLEPSSGSKLRAGSQHPKQHPQRPLLLRPLLLALVAALLVANLGQGVVVPAAAAAADVTLGAAAGATAAAAAGTRTRAREGVGLGMQAAAGTGTRRLQKSGGGGGSGASSGGGGGGDCQRPKDLTARAMLSLGCERFYKMCIDQQQFVTYDPKYNPRFSTLKVPTFDVRDMVYNWPNPWGNGDKFESGRDIRFPRVTIRVNTSAEECEDLQRPVFSRCTTPLVLWQKWMYNVGEMFEASYVRLYEQVVLTGTVDPAMSLVVATPSGLRLPSYADLFFGALFTRPVTTLGQFSRRYDPGTPPPSNATAEGRAIRCFETVYLCKVKNRKEDGMCGAGQHLLSHYSDRVPSVAALFEPEGRDRDTLKVVFASRPNATGRAILNEAELLAACNLLDPGEALRRQTPGPGGGGAPGGNPRGYRRVKCVGHVFGKDLLYDLALAKTIDVLVAAHGAAGYHAFYMTRGSSLVEVLPYRFNYQWVNAYYAKMLEFEKKVFYWSIWITHEANSRPSAFQNLTVFRTEYEHRERHIRLPWEALRHHLLSIIQVGSDEMSYRAAYLAVRHSIGDHLSPVDHRPNMEGKGWANYAGGGAGGV